MNTCTAKKWKISYCHFVHFVGPTVASMPTYTHNFDAWDKISDAWVWWANATMDYTSIHATSGWTIMPIHWCPLCAHVCRFGIFQPEDQCFTTFPSDPLTVPLPNNTYQIFYTPINNDTGELLIIVNNDTGESHLLRDIQCNLWNVTL